MSAATVWYVAGRKPETRVLLTFTGEVLGRLTFLAKKVSV